MTQVFFFFFWCLLHRLWFFSHSSWPDLDMTTTFQGDLCWFSKFIFVTQGLGLEWMANGWGCWQSARGSFSSPVFSGQTLLETPSHGKRWLLCTLHEKESCINKCHLSCPNICVYLFCVQLMVIGWNLHWGSLQLCFLGETWDFVPTRNRAHYVTVYRNHFPPIFHFLNLLDCRTLPSA